MGIFVSELIKYGLFLRVFLKKEFQYPKIVLAMFLCMAWLFSGRVSRQELPLAVVTFCIIIIELFFIQGTVTEKVQAVLIALFFLSCIEQILALTGRYIVARVVPVFADDVICYFANNIILILSFALWGGIRKKYKRRHKAERRKVSKILVAVFYIVIAVMMISLFMTASAVEIFLKHSTEKRIIVFSCILGVISFISIACAGAAFNYILYLNREKDALLQREIELKNAQKSYYETMLKREQETRRFRHDMTNHLLCLQEIMENETLDAAKDYIIHMQQGIRQIKDRSYETGNIILDSMLNYYLPALKQDADIAVTGSFRGTVVIRDPEFCTVISNVIQNAVEELIRIGEQEKVFRLHVKSGKRYVQIEVVNTTDREPVIYGAYHLPKTTKTDKKNHGMGLWNVQETMEKYDGVFEWGCDGKMFKVKLVLPCFHETGEKEEKEDGNRNL